MNILIHLDPGLPDNSSAQRNDLIHPTLEMLKQDLQQPGNRMLSECQLLFHERNRNLVQKIIGTQYQWTSYSGEQEHDTDKIIRQHMKNHHPKRIIQIGADNATTNLTDSIHTISVLPGKASPALYDAVQIIDYSSKNNYKQSNPKNLAQIAHTDLLTNIFKLKGTPLHHRKSKQIYQQKGRNILIVADLQQADAIFIEQLERTILSPAHEYKHFWITQYPNSKVDFRSIRFKRNLKRIIHSKPNSHWISNAGSASQYLILLSKFEQIITNNQHCMADCILFEKSVSAINQTDKIPTLTDILSPSHIPRSLIFSPQYFLRKIINNEKIVENYLSPSDYHLLDLKTGTSSSIRNRPMTQHWFHSQLESIDSVERKTRKLFRDPKQFFLDAKLPFHGSFT